MDLKVAATSIRSKLVTLSVEVNPITAVNLLKIRRYGSASLYFFVSTKDTVSSRVKMDEATDEIRYGPNYLTMTVLTIRYDTVLVLELVNDDYEEVLASLRAPLCSLVIGDGEESDRTLVLENLSGEAHVTVQVNVTAQYLAPPGRLHLDVVPKRSVRGIKKVASFLGKVIKALGLAVIVSCSQGFLD